MISRRRWLVRSSAAVAVLLAACANPREDARAELRDLRVAMEQHATRHGRYPETVDAARPDTPTNLPYRARRGASVRLVHAGADGFQALARRGPWICSMNVDAKHADRVECTPLSSSSPDTPASSAAPSPLDRVLRSPLPAGSAP